MLGLGLAAVLTIGGRLTRREGIKTWPGSGLVIVLLMTIGHLARSPTFPFFAWTMYSAEEPRGWPILLVVSGGVSRPVDLGNVLTILCHSRGHVLLRKLGWPLLSGRLTDRDPKATRKITELLQFVAEEEVQRNGGTCVAELWWCTVPYGNRDTSTWAASVRRRLLASSGDVR